MSPTLKSVPKWVYLMEKRDTSQYHIGNSGVPYGHTRTTKRIIIENRCLPLEGDLRHLLGPRSSTH